MDDLKPRVISEIKNGNNHSAKIAEIFDLSESDTNAILAELVHDGLISIGEQDINGRYELFAVE